MDLIDFADIFKNVRKGTFHRFLPSSVVKVINEKDGNKRDTKKPKNSSNSNNILKPVMNTQPVKAWRLRANKNYEKVFGGRKKEAFSPKLSVGCFPCTKWHTKGYCFEDCPNAKSHKILEGDNWKKTDKFIKDIRGE